MAPVLKADPRNGESLDKSKSPEQVAAEEAQRIKDLAELKERIRNKVPRKKKAVVEQEAPVIALKKVEIPVKVNPFLASNGEINAEELVEPLNTILKDIEHSLQLITKGYKLDGDKLFSSKVSFPDKFEYKPGVTRVSGKEQAFNLNKPSIVSLTYDDFHKDVYVDRVALKPIDVKELLKYPDKAKELLKTLIIDGMWKNLWETKQLDPKKKYFGNTMGTLKRPGMGETYCFVVSGDVDFIEIRLYSDATPLPEGN